MSVVERVAKAIGEVEPHTFDEATPEFMQALACAALEAMREPTLAMVLAGARKGWELADEYKAMIDGALK